MQGCYADDDIIFATQTFVNTTQLEATENAGRAGGGAGVCSALDV
jgi:hypothetical protein